MSSVFRQHWLVRRIGGMPVPGLQISILPFKWLNILHHGSKPKAWVSLGVPRRYRLWSFKENKTKQNKHKTPAHLRERHILYNEFPHSINRSPTANPQGLSDTFMSFLDRAPHTPPALFHFKTRACYQLHSVLLPLIYLSYLEMQPQASDLTQSPA